MEPGWPVRFSLVTKPSNHYLSSHCPIPFLHLKTLSPYTPTLDQWVTEWVSSQQTMAASTALISSTPSRAFSSKSTPLVASSSISKPISQTLTFPKSFNGLRLPRVAHSVSLSRGAHSRRSFLVKASVDELPLVGNVAPDFEAEAVFDQEFIKVESLTLRSFSAIACCNFYFWVCGNWNFAFEFQVKLSEYIGKKYVILFFYPLDFTFVCPTGLFSPSTFLCKIFNLYSMLSSPYVFCVWPLLQKSLLSAIVTLSLRNSTQKSWVFQLTVW